MKDRPDPGVETLEEEPASETRLVTDLVDELVICLVHTRIYSAGHHRVENAVRVLRNRLRDLTARTNGSTTKLEVAGSYIIYDGRPLLGASLTAARLLRMFAEKKVGGIELDSDVSEEELRAFFEALGGAKTSRPAESADLHRPADAWNELLRTRGCHRARLLPIRHVEIEGFRDGTSHGFSSVTTYQGVVHLLQETTISVCQGGTVDFDAAAEHMTHLTELLDLDPDGILKMCRYERYDAFTFGHSIRVCLLASSLVASLTPDPDLRLRVGTAALLHDIGKSRVSFDVIHCQTRLTKEQRREMERHPEFGAEILLDHEHVDPLAVTAAFGHHQADGRHGYPLTRHEAEQSLVTRIIKICDVFEALTAVRPYKDAMTAVRAYRIMMKMQPHFDRSLLRRFIQVNGFYPVGTRVRLSNGELARVVRQSLNPRLPVVVLEDEADGGVEGAIALVDPIDDRIVRRNATAMNTMSIVCAAEEIDLSDPRFEHGLWVQEGGKTHMAA